MSKKITNQQMQAWIDAKWSGWQELNRRAHSPKTCRWRLHVFPRLLPLKKFIKHIDKQDGDKHDDDKSSACRCTGHLDLDLVR
jgi:hypothetical protein